MFKWLKCKIEPQEDDENLIMFPLYKSVLQPVWRSTLCFYAGFWGIICRTEASADSLRTSYATAYTAVTRFKAKQ